MSSVHLIDEKKQFANQLDAYVDKCYLGDRNLDNGLNYHIVSVFGSQSTGKSTLLNRLFGTKFDVMDEEKRQQTTKGIWFSHANYIASNKSDDGKQNNDKNIYVLDVEGVDGRERADDKDFERKSALFALATSEILIVNIFEHQVGLYQGANMELLKTVMEVNLSLFHKQNEKCLLLFVVRDFTGLTPLSNLGGSLESDMNKIWLELNKPEECQDSKLQDFFDLKFFSISHKHYQPEKFESDIKELGDDFLGETFFHDNLYHKRIPIDAWALYSEKIWDQIENNKDLDLPTQQILVSKFKCNEILNLVYDETFLPQFTALKDPTLNPIDSCKFFKELREKCLSLYDSQASRYKNPVYLDIRNDLVGKIDLKLKEFHVEILSQLSVSLLSQLDIDFPLLKKSNTKASFQDLLTGVLSDVTTTFKEKAVNYSFVSESDDTAVYVDNYQKECEILEKNLSEFANNMKSKESNILAGKISKKFQSKFKDYIVEEISQPTLASWDNILQNFNDLTTKLLNDYKVDDLYDFKIGLSEDANEALHLKIMKNCWNKFDSITHDFINDDSVSRILRNLFEDSFKFDSNGLPLIWKTFNQLDTQFNNSRDYALKLFPILCNIKLSNGKTIQKPFYNFDDDEYDDDMGSDLDSDVDFETTSDGAPDKNSKFTKLLSAKQQAKVRQRFKKETDAIYLDAKRSMVANKTSIPTFIYVLLILLGWNEFMAVLRNPVLFILVIIAITGLYFAYNMQMLGPMLTVANAMANQTKTVIKDKLRDALLDDHEKGSNSATSSHSASAEKDDSYELQDL